MLAKHLPVRNTLAINEHPLVGVIVNGVGYLRTEQLLCLYLPATAL